MIRVALGQINPTVGDLPANEQKILDTVSAARAAGAQVVILPELTVCGYPPEDLLLREDFVAACDEALQRVAAHACDIVVACGFPRNGDRDLHNSLAVCVDGQVRAVYDKVHLPNYGVFSERRYFAAGAGPAIVRVNGTAVALTICEDIWVPGGPHAAAAAAGAQLIVNASASPYERGKPARRERMLAQRARDNTAAIAYVNCVGGQDELVFDGSSLIVDHAGRVLARGAQFEEDLVVCDVPVGRVGRARRRDPRLRGADADAPVLANLRTPAAPPADQPAPAVWQDDLAEVYHALVCGTRDYVRKTGFADVVLGLSGGIDSALVALIACDALGADHVHCISMPSKYSTAGTQTDARTLADNLAVDFSEIPIADGMAAFETMLAPRLAGTTPDVTEENLQARIRGTLLMALSNKFGWLLLSTGNKSEMSVGYATLYGDMSGGFNPLKDVPKTTVFALTAWRNQQAGRDLCPTEIITRPPSAELSDGQADTDSLPPYDILDAILARYVDEDLAVHEIVADGYDEATVRRVVGLVDGAEYKRRQAPPGVKITARALSRDRRMPIINRFAPAGR